MSSSDDDDRGDAPEAAHLLDLRAQIRALHADKSLDPRERAHRMQMLLRGGGGGGSSSTAGGGNAGSSSSSASSSTAAAAAAAAGGGGGGVGPDEFEHDASKLDRSKSFRPDGETLGCQHYARGAKLRAACCGRLFACRLCHDDAVAGHAIDRHATAEMLCMHCSELQPVGQVCAHCGKELAAYFCGVCKFWDDSGRDIFHCDDCGICRVGTRDQYFHCPRCQICLAAGLEGNHECIENNFRQPCPVCHQDLFQSRTPGAVLPCGHSMHSSCHRDCLRHNNFKCPLCNRSTIDMSAHWAELDAVVGMTPMPREFRHAVADVLCNDCQESSTDVAFHFYGHKCKGCGSYNTVLQGTRGMPAFDARGNIVREEGAASSSSSEDEGEDATTAAGAAAGAGDGAGSDFTPVTPSSDDEMPGLLESPDEDDEESEDDAAAGVAR